MVTMTTDTLFDIICHIWCFIWLSLELLSFKIILIFCFPSRTVAVASKSDMEDTSFDYVANAMRFPVTVIDFEEKNFAPCQMIVGQSEIPFWWAGGSIGYGGLECHVGFKSWRCLDLEVMKVMSVMKFGTAWMSWGLEVLKSKSSLRSWMSWLLGRSCRF